MSRVKTLVDAGPFTPIADALTKESAERVLKVAQALAEKTKDLLPQKQEATRVFIQKTVFVNQPPGVITTDDVSNNWTLLKQIFSNMMPTDWIDFMGNVITFIPIAVILYIVLVFSYKCFFSRKGGDQKKRERNDDMQQQDEDD